MALRGVKTRGVGVTLMLVGVVFVIAYWVVPVPDFDELEGTVKLTV